MEQINNLMMKGLESAAQLSIGQAFLRGVDRMMWTIEKSVQWSLPRTETNTEENGKSFGEIEFIRPLPWILFLPSIIILRIVRASLNVAALILGYPKIQPVDMVRFMQKNRRRLRAIKSRGLKNMREKNPAIEKAHPTTIGIRENKNAENSMLSPNHVNDTKRKYSELSSSDDECSESDDEPIIDKIDRMANEDSETDDDFIPEGEVSIDSVSSAESDLMNISNTEIQDIKAEKEDMEKIFILKDSEKEEKNPNNHLQMKVNPALNGQ